MMPRDGLIKTTLLLLIFSTASVLLEASPVPPEKNNATEESLVQGAAVYSTTLTDTQGFFSMATGENNADYSWYVSPTGGMGFISFSISSTTFSCNSRESK